MKKVTKVGMFIASLVLATSVNAYSCTCTSGQMTAEILDDGTVKLSCSGGGQVHCTF